MTNQPFNEEQKQYLQGFFTAVHQQGIAPFAGLTPDGQFTEQPGQATSSVTHPPEEEDALHGTPYAKLNKEERAKLEANPLDMWDKMTALAATDEAAQGMDVFRFKFHGLFNTAPIHPGYMLRTRIPGCVVDSRQMHGLADIAEDFGGGYSHVTTRGNLQIREIAPRHTVPTITRLYDYGLTSRGAGGDNIRNITASPTSGCDPQELIDCRELSTAMHHAILNTREFYGLPRKFNIAFDGGGAISIMSDTNDIGFVATRFKTGEGEALGGTDHVYFKVLLGGVTGHGHFAKDSGLLLRPEECVAFACGVLRVYVANGNRSNRKRARLAFCVESMGMESFLKAVEEHITFVPLRVAAKKLEARPPIDRMAHVGIYPQPQDDLHYVGVAMLVGKMTVEQMRGLADLARNFGDDTVHFTIWQNIILTGIHTDVLEAVKAELLKLGFHYEPSTCMAGLAACTGNTGCKLAQTDTKGHAAAIATHFEAHYDVQSNAQSGKQAHRTPALNIVLTGCPNSCAQHFCADVGLLGIKTKIDGESVEAYNVTLGGGTDHDQGLGREMAKAVPHDKLPAFLVGVNQAYAENRTEGEEFVDFVRRHSPEDFKQLIHVEQSA